MSGKRLPKELHIIVDGHENGTPPYYAFLGSVEGPTLPPLSHLTKPPYRDPTHALQSYGYDALYGVHRIARSYVAVRKTGKMRKQSVPLLGRVKAAVGRMEWVEAGLMPGEVKVWILERRPRLYLASHPEIWGGE